MTEFIKLLFGPDKIQKRPIMPAAVHKSGKLVVSKKLTEEKIKFLKDHLKKKE